MRTLLEGFVDGQPAGKTLLRRASSSRPPQLTAAL
jgi:hypothetical protein